MAKNQAEPKSGLWRKLLTVPGVIATTALTALVGAGVTWTINTAREAQFQPSDAIKISLETDPGKMNSVVDTYLRPVIIPPSVQTKGSPANMGCAGFRRWAVENHGVDAGETVVEIVAQGVSEKPVLIRNMRVEIIDKSPPMSGIAAMCNSQGIAQRRGIEVLLDADPPSVDYKSDSNTPFGFTLAKGETEIFLVSAKALYATYRWKIYFDIVVNGEAEPLEVTIKDGFVTTAAPERDDLTWLWDYVDEKWWRTDESRIIATAPASEPLPIPE